MPPGAALGTAGRLKRAAFGVTDYHDSSAPRHRQLPAVDYYHYASNMPAPLSTPRFAIDTSRQSAALIARAHDAPLAQAPPCLLPSMTSREAAAIFSEGDGPALDDIRHTTCCRGYWPLNSALVIISTATALATT